MQTITPEISSNLPKGAMHDARYDTRKQRRRAPPPLDTVVILGKSFNGVNLVAHYPPAISSSSPTATTTKSCTATAVVPSRRSRNLTHIASFNNDISSNPLVSPSCFSPAYSLVTNSSSPVFSGARGSGREKRIRIKTSATICIPSPSSEFDLPLKAAIDRLKTSFVAPLHNSGPGRSRNSTTSACARRYATILPSQYQYHSFFHQELEQDEQEYSPSTPANDLSELPQPEERRHTGAMTFRDSLNSASTCVDSPTRTLPLTGTIKDRTSDPYAKCYDLVPNQIQHPGTHAGEMREAHKDDTGDLCTDGEEHEEDGDIDDEQGGLVLVNDQDFLLQKESEVMPWLQEAIQTVGVLEARLIELEEDCQAIPLYEQNRVQMIQMIQDLDAIVQQDQAWIENAENAVRWTSFALEDALLSSGHANILSAPELSSSNRSVLISGATNGQLERRSQSEGTLPSMTTIVSGGHNAVHGPKTAIPSPDLSHRTDLASDSVLGNRKRSRLQQELEIEYRNAIMTALKHLKAIELSQSSKGEGGNAGERNKKTARPNMALEKWLDNASMMSLVSNNNQNIGAARSTMRDDDDEQSTVDPREDENLEDDENQLSLTRTAGAEREEDPNGNLAIPFRSSSSRKSLSLSNRSLQSVECAEPSDPVQLQATSRSASTRILDHSVSTASFQATISGSSQSLKTDLGGCLMDERVFLKQHIQTLDRLRLQEQVRHQRTDQVHQQLIFDLTRFSKELLQSVNDLTCTQAALDEASELALLTLRAADVADVSNGFNEPVEQAKLKRMIGASCKGLAQSMGMVEQGIKRMRTLAADCVGITEFALGQGQGLSPTEEPMQRPSESTPVTTSVSPPSPPSPPLILGTDLSHANNYASSASPMAITPMAPACSGTTLLTVTDQKVSSIFVDGIAFQEFETHLTSLRATLISISRTISLRKGAQRSTVTGILSVAPLLNTDTTPFMRRVLVEDIYPCLLIHPRSVGAKQGGWINAFLHSSTTTAATSTSALSYGPSPQTPGFQQLLKAMERNACEIEFWTTNHRRASLQQPQANVDAPIVTKATAPKVTCCLCGIARPCEFRLRIVDQDEANQNSPDTRSHTSCAGRRGQTIDDEQRRPLDRFCRDRIVAVCDFYMFLGHLRQGLLDHQSNLELFRRALWLRQRMGCARIGSMDIVQASSTLPLSDVARE